FSSQLLRRQSEAPQPGYSRGSVGARGEFRQVTKPIPRRRDHAEGLRKVTATGDFFRGPRVSTSPRCARGETFPHAAIPVATMLCHSHHSRHGLPRGAGEILGRAPFPSHRTRKGAVRRRGARTRCDCVTRRGGTSPVGDRVLVVLTQRV